MDMKLEVVVIPVADVDRAKAFNTVADLADALRRAEAAHAKHEQETGQPDRTGPTGTPSTWWPKQTGRTETDGRLRLRRHRAGGRVAG